MEPDDEHPRDLLAAAGLGSLDPQNERELSAHLGRCQECRALLAEYRTAGALLPYALTPSEPSPDVRNRLQLGLQRRDRSSGWRRILGGIPRPPMSLRGGVAAVLVAGLLVWNLTMQFGRPNQVAEVERLARAPHGHSGQLVGAGITARASGRFYVDEEDVGGAVAVSGLPALLPGREYQLWFIRADGTRASGGTFGVDDRGGAALIVQIPGHLSDYLGIGITDEPAGGSSNPSAGDLLIGTL